MNLRKDSTLSAALRPSSGDLRWDAYDLRHIADRLRGGELTPREAAGNLNMIAAGLDLAADAWEETAPETLHLPEKAGLEVVTGLEVFDNAG